MKTESKKLTEGLRRRNKKRKKFHPAEIASEENPPFQSNKQEKI